MNIDRLAQLQRQFLVHSFLYYQLDEPIWEDEQYDQCCKELHAMMKESSDEGPYHNLCEKLDESCSGFYLSRSDYPGEIITTALRLLYLHNEVDIGFDEFVARYGYTLEKTGQIEDTTGASIFLS